MIQNIFSVHCRLAQSISWLSILILAIAIVTLEVTLAKKLPRFGAHRAEYALAKPVEPTILEQAGYRDFDPIARIHMDTSCASWVTEVEIQLTGRYLDDRPLDVKIIERQEEFQDGTGMRFHVTVKDAGMLSREVVGKILRVPNGSWLLEMLKPQPIQTLLPSRLTFALARAAALIESARSGKTEIASIAFLPASVRVIDIHSRIKSLKKPLSIPYQDDKLLKKPIWHITETTRMRDADDQITTVFLRELFMGEDLIPLVMIQDISNVRGRLELKSLKYEQPRCSN